MFTIEEAKAARNTASVNIPAGACREFGKGSVERAIEERTATQQAALANDIRTALGQAWNKLTGANSVAAQAEEAAR